MEELSTQLEQEQQQVVQHKDKYEHCQNQHVLKQDTYIVLPLLLPAYDWAAKRSVRQMWQPELWQQHTRAVCAAACRITELEAELSRIRDLVILLGKAMGRLPGGQQLPGHDDPVWLKLGPLGGVSFALDAVMQHTRVSGGSGCAAQETHWACASHCKHHGVRGMPRLTSCCAHIAKCRSSMFVCVSSKLSLTRCRTVSGLRRHRKQTCR